MRSFAPATEKEMIDTLTGIFEGGNYCTIADNPADLRGGLSYGKHQVCEIQGTLIALLKDYVARVDAPLPDPAIVAALNEHIALFNASGARYGGTTEQRTSFKQVLNNACHDPAMQETQDEFFERGYFDPAMQHASEFGIETTLGKSIFYDIAIQAGANRLSFYRLALNRWNAEHPGTVATACAPKDAAGPDEKTFLNYVGEARRAEMLRSSSAAYKASVYRPNEFDTLLGAGNMGLTGDFTFRGCSIKGLQA
jgi:chitosanase